MHDKHLFLGGARSGKSTMAEQAASEWLRTNPHGKVVYIATAQTLDEEMQQRVAYHQQSRPANWELIEEPLALAELLDQYKQSVTPNAPVCMLVDCLTLWLSNQLCQVDVADDSVLANHAANDTKQTINQLVASVEMFPGTLLLVSNEVGSGIVPLGKLSRVFQDLSGMMNQRLAQVSDKVTLVVAGLPMSLKA
jgi:adenosylcobinamide kinase/adenosylcobinamide-phosphate guanylyltransferase